VSGSPIQRTFSGGGSSDREGKAVRKYLELYAEPESRRLPTGCFSHVVVVPASGEGESLLESIEAVPGGRARDVLVILVLNARADADPEHHAANDTIRRRLGGEGLHPASCGSLWLIDRARNGCFLPEKQGVGLARKIGCDVALALQAGGQVASRFLHTTDADAIVPTDYLARSRNEEASGAAALLYPFQHIPAEDGAPVLAIKLYECWLRYHVLGLRAAGSPYAFHAIGSTLALDATSYAQVRGFPRRMAGEDFYILNKLAKVGPVRSISGEPIRVSGRASDRVPFGTGRAMRELLAGPVSVDSYRLPDPVIYELVGVWLALLKEAAIEPSLGEARRAQERLMGGEVSDILIAALEQTRSFDLLAHAVAMPLDSSNRLRRLHTAFDGFRTLKLLHTLRDLAFPPLPFREALTRAKWLKPNKALEYLSVDLTKPTRSGTSCEKFHKEAGFDGGTGDEEIAIVEVVRAGLERLES
jgi:hypothetical protein